MFVKYIARQPRLMEPLISAGNGSGRLFYFVVVMLVSSLFPPPSTTIRCVPAFVFAPTFQVQETDPSEPEVFASSPLALLAPLE